MRSQERTELQVSAQNPTMHTRGRREGADEHAEGKLPSRQGRVVRPRPHRGEGQKDPTQPARRTAARQRRRQGGAIGLPNTEARASSAPRGRSSRRRVCLCSCVQDRRGVSHSTALKGGSVPWLRDLAISFVTDAVHATCILGGIGTSLSLVDASIVGAWVDDGRCGEN